MPPFWIGFCAGVVCAAVVFVGWIFAQDDFWRRRRYDE